MSELKLENLVKVYPYTVVSNRLFGRKRAREALERERAMPYTTDEGVVAVQEFSLTVGDGEFVVLLGPSGSGKSTVLRMIAGLETVSDGEIVMDGQVINDLLPEDRDIAMVFQNYSLYPNFTVYENIAYPLKNLHIPRAEVDRTVRQTAALLELTDYLDRRPAELSGGQRQRAAIGRALVRKPKLFLMDEPFSNLDTALREKLRDELKRLHKRLGVTVIYVTHDQMDAFHLGDRIVVMRDGMIVQSGTPQELYNRPVNLYTASFLGTPPINLIQAVPVIRQGGANALRLLDTEIGLPMEKAAALAGRKSVTVGIRPVHIVPVQEGGIRAVVQYAEIIGAEYHLHLKTADTELTVVMPYSPKDEVRSGNMVQIRLNPKKFHFFDSDTGMRIF